MGRETVTLCGVNAPAAPMRKTEIPMLCAVLTGAAALAYGAFKIAGFIGVGVLGLLIGFIAVRVELEKGGAVGGDFASGLYAQQASAQQRMSRAERAAHRAELASLARPLLIAKIIGAALIALGFGGFFYLG